MAMKVLFLCTGNSARSQMAEAFLRKHGGTAYEAYSAGLEPTEINPMTVRVMQEKGIDLAGQRAKDVSEYMGKVHFGYMITLCDSAAKNCPVGFPGLGQRLHWPIEDPAAAVGDPEQRLQRFRAARDQVEDRVREFIGRAG